MDEDMSFPNPVERHDLPVKKSRWPKVIAVVLVFGVLCVAFLPQILHTRIGRRFLRAKLEGKYPGEVIIEDFRTSWFGGTSAHQFWIKGGDGRVVGFGGFQSDKLSLLKLLRGKYELGHCTIDGMIIEYNLDNGESGHTDSYERLTGTGPRVAGAPPAVLSKLSGQITMTGAQLALSRGEVDPRTLTVSTQTVKFNNLYGTFDIPSLDQTWKFDVTGDGGLKAKGTLCLGHGGVLTPADVSAEVTASAEHLSSDLAAVLLPQLSVADCRSAFGETFDQTQVSLSGTGGVLKLHAQALAQHGRLDLAPTFDLKTQPAGMTISGGEQMIACALPRGYAGMQLKLANPMLADAIEANLTLHLTALDAPFGRSWFTGSGKGRLEVRDVKTSARAGAMTRQIKAVSGSESLSNQVTSAAELLSFDGGVINVEPTEVIVGDTKTTLAGSANVDGRLNYTLSLSGPRLAAVAGQASIRLPLVGTSAEPRLDVDAAGKSLGSKFTEWVARQGETFRRRELEAAQAEKDRQVQESLKPVAGETGR